MKKNILISGAGGAATPILIDELKHCGFCVTAVDMDKFSVGFLHADNSYVVPAATDPAFSKIIKNIVQKESIDLYIPLVDEELLYACSLASSNLRVLLPAKHFVELCLNKFDLMIKLREIGVGVPETRAIKDANFFSGDFIIKPIMGRGSRGVKKLAGKDGIKKYMQTSQYKEGDLLAQEFISGEEF